MNNLTNNTQKVDEIFSTPKWIIPAISLTILLALFVMSQIKYPDTVSAPVKIVLKNTSKEILSKRAGRIRLLSKTNGKKVEENEVIAWLESSVDIQELNLLYDLLNNIQETQDLTNNTLINSIDQSTFIHLGELHSPYHDFLTQFNQYKRYHINGYQKRKLDLLNSEIKIIELQIESAKHHKELTEKDIKLSFETYTTNKQLWKEKIISTEDLRLLESKLLNKQSLIPQLESIILERTQIIQQKKDQIADIRFEMTNQTNLFKESIIVLKSKIDQWIQENTIQAPISGILNFTLPIEENQTIIGNVTYGYVTTDKSLFSAQVIIPQNNFGHVRLNQRVLVRLDAYPQHTFGSIEGTLTYISSIPNESGYLGLVQLRDCLTSENHDDIRLEESMKGNALIITKEYTLLGRFFNLIRTSNE